MNNKFLTISQAAERIGVSIQTLRRWDESGRLISIRKKDTSHRYYKEIDIDKFLNNYVKNLYKLAERWAAAEKSSEVPADYYCKDISVFQGRLTRLQNDLGKVYRLNKIYPLISAITGEIGNNSFDHNLGNWPDVPGIFFAYDLNKGQVILADRGRGILNTLKKVKPELSNHQDALRVAFTEIISGRSPEYRGNGLKFVKNVVVSNEIDLKFTTGDAQLTIQKNDHDLDINKSKIYIQGCLVLIKF